MAVRTLKDCSCDGRIPDQTHFIQMNLSLESEAIKNFSQVNAPVMKIRSDKVQN